MLLYTYIVRLTIHTRLEKIEVKNKCLGSHVAELIFYIHELTFTQRKSCN